MVVVNSLIAYELVNLFEDVSWTISIVTFAVICAMLLGLLEIAATMADPFGVSSHSQRLMRLSPCIPFSTGSLARALAATGRHH